MPVGPYETFDACLLAMKDKGHSEESARAICGKLQAETEGKEMAGLSGQWIEVFRAGDYGEKGSYSTEDLERLAATYDPKLHAAPVVIGHPAHDQPAWGWVEALRRAGESLWAKLTKVDPQFEQLVKDGRFTQRSVALYTKMPQTGGPYLRHLGFLGAAPPEVKGLEPIHFSDGKFVAIEFKEDDVDIKEISKAVDERIRAFFTNLFGEKKGENISSFTEAQVKEIAGQAVAEATKPLTENLAKMQTEFSERQKKATDAATAAAAAASKSKVAAFLEKLKAANHWVPAFEKGKLNRVLEYLATGETVSFAEKDKDGKDVQVSFGQAEAAAALQTFLEELPAIVPLGQIYAPKPGKVLAMKFNETRDLKVDPESVALNERAEAIAAELHKQDPKLSDLAAFKEGLAQARAEGAQTGAMTAGKV